MTSLRRSITIAAAVVLSTTSASAKIVGEDDGGGDASIAPSGDGGARTPEGAPPANIVGAVDAGADAAEDEPGHVVLADASPTLSFPSVTGERYSAPDVSEDDGCHAAPSSSGSLSTAAAGVCAVLGLAWSRRRRHRGRR